MSNNTNTTTINPTIIPRHSRLLVRKLPEESSILLPDQLHTNTSRWQVLAIGLDITDLAVGDVVWLIFEANKIALPWTTADNLECLVHESSVLCKLQ